MLVGRITSDATGAWLLNSNNGGQHYLVEYKAGTPDVAGTSVRTLVGS